MSEVELADLPEGWLSSDEASALSALAHNQLVLEIGSWQGRSTVAMARAALHVVSVDHHRGSAEHETYEPSLPRLVENLQSYGVRDKVSVCVLDSKRLQRFFKPALFDGVFVDGGHDQQASEDAASAAYLVKTGGWICFHDYSEGWPQVRQAVDWLQRGGWRLRGLAGSLVVLQQ